MVDYVVSAELTLRDMLSPSLDKVIERLDKATTTLATFQERLDKLSSRGLTRLMEQLERLDRVTWPGQLVEGAERFDRLLMGADEKMAALAGHAVELARAMKDLRVPNVPAVPGGRVPGRIGHGGGDPIMTGIGGGAVLEFLGGNYERFSSVDQVYRAMQGDTALAGPNNPKMAALRDNAAAQLARYRTLKPLDVAKNAAEAYTIGGGNMAEQPALANMLDRVEQSLVLRGKSPEDAQRQAIATVRGLDIGNRFFDRKTGEFDQKRADTEADTVVSMLSASNGLMTGQNYLAFMKSSGLAGQNLSVEGMAKLAHFIDINPSRSGTALKSFENLFGGHATRMSKKDKSAWTAAGLYDKNGLLVDNDMLTGPNSDPLGWIEKHKKQLTAIRVSDRTQRQNVASFIAETDGSQGNINRGAAAVARQDVAGNSQNLLDSPIGKTLQFEASLEKFRVSLGKFESGPGAMILDKLASGLDKLTAAMEKHPEAAENLLKLSAALAAFAVVRGVATLLGLGEGITVLGKALSLLSKGGSGGGAISALTAAEGAGSLALLATRLTALGAVVSAVILALDLIKNIGPANPHPHTNAHGQGYSGRPEAPPGAPAPHDGGWGMFNGSAEVFRKALSDFMNQPASQPPQNARGLPASKIDYRGGDVHVYIDGDEITTRVERRQAWRAGRPSAYGNSPDPLEVVPRPGMPVVAL